MAVDAPAAEAPKRVIEQSAIKSKLIGRGGSLTKSQFDTSVLPDDVVDARPQNIQTGAVAHVEMEEIDTMYGKDGWRAIRNVGIARPEEMNDSLQESLHMIATSEEMSSMQRFRTYQEIANRLQQKLMDTNYWEVAADTLSILRQQLEAHYSVAGIKGIEQLVDFASVENVGKRNPKSLDSIYWSLAEALMDERLVTVDQRQNTIAVLRDLLEYYAQLSGRDAAFGKKANDLLAEQKMLELSFINGVIPKYQDSVAERPVNSLIEMKLCAAVALREAHPEIIAWNHHDVEHFLNWVMDKNPKESFAIGRRSLIRWFKAEAHVWYDQNGVKKDEMVARARLTMRMSALIALRRLRPDVVWSVGAVQHFVIDTLATHQIEPSLQGEGLVRFLTPLAEAWIKTQRVDFAEAPQATHAADNGILGSAPARQQVAMRQEPVDYHAGSQLGSIANRLGFDNVQVLDDGTQAPVETPTPVAEQKPQGGLRGFWQRLVGSGRNRSR